MPRLLSVSRAARLVGISRGELQKRISNGEIESFEGKVHIADVERLYPDFQLEDNTIIENIERIIELALQRARGEKLQKLLTPDFETLLSRLTVLSSELTRTQQQLRAFSQLYTDLQQHLQDISQSCAQPAVIAELVRWLDRQAEEISAIHPETAPLLVHDTVLQLIAAQVHIQPSGHEFFVDGSNSILEAGLSAGLALSYGCSNGNCGKCKARLLSGKIRKVRDFDHVFSAIEKNQNYFLTCSHTPVTDIIIEANEAGSAAEIPLQDIDAKIKRIDAIDDRHVVLNIKTPRTRRLRFLAGQNVELSNHLGHNLTLPIASCPCDDMNIQFHLPAHSSNVFINDIHQMAKPGDSIHIHGPNGDFILDDDNTAPLMFIAFDTGFAPIKSLIEHAVTLDNAEFTQLYWLHDGEYPYLHNHCRAWQDALDNFRYSHLRIDMENANELLEKKLERITEDYSNLHDFYYYLCGSGPLLEITRHYLVRQGVVAEQILTQALDAPV